MRAATTKSGKRKRRNDVFGHSVTQIAEVLVGAQIIERKNGYGRKNRGDFLRGRLLMDANSRGLFLQKFNLRSVRALR